MSSSVLVDYLKIAAVAAGGILLFKFLFVQVLQIPGLTQAIASI